MPALALPCGVIASGLMGWLLCQLTPIGYDTPVAMTVLVGVAGGAFIIGRTLQKIMDKLRTMERLIDSLPCRRNDTCPENEE
jgi:hypothetical protein